jgi:SAM-dependent methyltransferase
MTDSSSQPRAGAAGVGAEEAGEYACRIRAFYAGEIARHGYNHGGVGWRRHASQQRRFEVLAAVGDLQGRRVLDVGAGLGDFARYLWERGVTPDYTGIDLCEDLVEAARARLAGDAGGPASMVVADILELAPPEPFDYVVASGIFGLRTPQTVARIAPTLERMFGLCRRGVAVNFLSARAVKQAERSQYVEPSEVLAHALRVTPAATLRHDYLPNDFTLYLYREPRWPSLAATKEGVG